MRDKYDRCRPVVLPVRKSAPVEEETFDVRFEEVVSLVDEERLGEASVLITSILNEGTVDLRLVIYLFYAQFISQGIRSPKDHSSRPPSHRARPLGKNFPREHAGQISLEQLDVVFICHRRKRSSGAKNSTRAKRTMIFGTNRSTAHFKNTERSSLRIRGSSRPLRSKKRRSLPLINTSCLSLNG